MRRYSAHPCSPEWMVGHGAAGEPSGQSTQLAPLGAMLQFHMIPCWVRIAYALAAVTASALYGWYAVEIFLGVPAPGKLVHRQFRSWRNHQRWFNFAGSIVGWICLWIVGVKLWPFAVSDSYPSFTWGDAGLSFVAFLGVTGHVPMTVFNLAQAIAALVGKLSGGGKE